MPEPINTKWAGLRATSGPADRSSLYLLCGYYEGPPRPHYMGCSKVSPHTYVEQRAVGSLVADLVAGWEQLYRSECCGVVRRFGFTTSRMREPQTP